MVLPAVEAAAINLPGSLRYPSYVVPPTNAVRTGPGGLAPQPVNADYLSLHADALDIMFQIGGSGVSEEPAMVGGFAISYPADEPRRMWQVAFHDRQVNAGLLVKNRNANGVGSPGKWDLTHQEPVWVPDPVAATAPADGRTWRDVPVRDLLPNEALQATLMGIGVVRTDRRLESNKQTGQFTPEDRALLQAIHQALVRSN